MMETSVPRPYSHDPDPSRRFIAFDMFGTLVVNRYGDLDRIFQVFYGFFPDATPEEVQREYENLLAIHSRSHGDVKELTIPEVMRHLDGVFGTSNDYLDAEDAMMRRTGTFVAADGARETLSYFRDHGYRIGVLSNTAYRSSVVAGVLEDNGMADLVDAVVTSADVGYRKPDSRAYDAVVHAIGGERGLCYFVGDSRDRDHTGPLRYGMKGAFLIDHHCSGKEDSVVRCIGDIPSLFSD